MIYDIYGTYQTEIRKQLSEELRNGNKTISVLIEDDNVMLDFTAKIIEDDYVYDVRDLTLFLGNREVFNDDILSDNEKMMTDLLDSEIEKIK